MTLNSFIDKFKIERGYTPRIGFVGLGISNLALASRLSGVNITARDRRITDRTRLLSINANRVIEGENYLDGIDEDILVLSPSIRRDIPEISNAMRRGSVVTSDAELYFLDSAGRDRLVTGSDGKSTTATLAALLLKESDPDIAAIGNIGVPFSSYGGKGAVAELSSFQLSYITPRSKAAIITTITPNHLNWHSSLDEYIDAKLNIARETERLILSPDTPLEAKLLSTLRPKTVYSIIYPLRALTEMAPFADDYYTLEDGAISHNGKRLIAISELARQEKHNVHNLMGAIALATWEFSPAHLKRVASEFHGLEHRMEKFLTYNGVDFINSSIDTTPARTRATLDALGRPTRIILGGGAKGLSIRPIIPSLSEHATRIALYGDAGKQYLGELNEGGMADGEKIRLFKEFDGALKFILEGLSPGDTVLLSPAATGYGEFKDFAERGKHFKDHIKKLYSK